MKNLGLVIASGGILINLIGVVQEKDKLTQAGGLISISGLLMTALSK